MSPCPNHLTTRKAISKSLATLSGSASLSRLPSHCIRHTSSSTSTASTATKSDTYSRHVRPEPLTLLHKTRNILPRIIGKGGPGFQRMVPDAWDSVLAKAHEDLSATGERPVKVVVCGLDEWSGAQDLVTALLADPLSSDNTQLSALKNRWLDPSLQKILFSHNSVVNANTPSPFKISSGYLTQFPVPVEFTELRPPPGSSSASSSSIPKDNLLHTLENATFLDSDIRIIVCNPVTTPIDAILDSRIPINTILVLSSNIPQTDLEAIVHERTSQSHSYPPHSHTRSRHYQVISADPGRSIQAVSILQANPSSPSAIQKYSANFVGSQLSRVTQALHDKLAPVQNLKSVQRKLGLEHLQEILDWSLVNVNQTRNELDKAFIDQSAFKETLEEHRARIEGDVLGTHNQSNEKAPINVVIEAIKQAERDMRPVMDGLTWWRMIWRVDEISNIVATATARTWCSNLEKKLIFETGHLSVLQNETSKLAFSLLSNHPTVSTAVLRNALLQIQRSPGYYLTAESLTQPIFSRRSQIIEYPTMRLHVSGQRAVLGMTGGIVGGAGIGWAGWLGWLIGSGEGLLGFLGMDAGTAMGVGMLSAVASIRWAVGRWEKSKLRWWQDWARVGEGLERDLKFKLQTTMERQIVVLGETACDGMAKSIRAHEEELAGVVVDIEEIQAGLQEVLHGCQSKS